jgi:hypothetical protein
MFQTLRQSGVVCFLKGSGDRVRQKGHLVSTRQNAHNHRTTASQSLITFLIKTPFPLERNRPTIKGRPLLTLLNILSSFKEINPYQKKSLIQKG